MSDEQKAELLQLYYKYRAATHYHAGLLINLESTIEQKNAAIRTIIRADTEFLKFVNDKI